MRRRSVGLVNAACCGVLCVPLFHSLLWGFTMKSVNAAPAPLRMARDRQRGQGMTEYIIIVALIAVAAIGVYGFFGKTIRNQVAGLAAEVAGEDGSAQIKAAGSAASSAAGEGAKDKGLSSYGNATDAGSGGGAASSGGTAATGSGG